MNDRVKMDVMKAFPLLLCLFLLLVPQMAMAAPAYPMEGLLPRAETVFVGTVTEQNKDTIVLSVCKHLRGENTKQFTLKLAYWLEGSHLELNSRYFVISQGDNLSGPPEPIVTIGQGIIGQSGYCGWIMFPLDTEGKKTYLRHVDSYAGDKLIGTTLKGAQKMVKRIPYNPNVRGKRQEQAVG